MKKNKKQKTWNEENTSIKLNKFVCSDCLAVYKLQSNCDNGEPIGWNKIFTTKKLQQQQNLLVNQKIKKGCVFVCTGNLGKQMIIWFVVWKKNIT